MSSSRRSARYLEEDVSLTSSRELWGWYAYSMAAEVFAICGTGSFLPVTLEQLARERGVLKSDGVTPCISSPGASPARLRFLVHRELQNQDTQCVIKPFGSYINTSSFALYSFSLGVLVQALTLVSISAVADHGANRKRLLVILASAGSTACMLFLFVFPSIYLVGSLLVIIGVTCLGSSFVLLNSFLPLFVLNHASNQARSDLLRDESNIPMTSVNSEDDHSDAPNLDQLKDQHRPVDLHTVSKTSPELLLSSEISSKGVGIGYSAAVFMQLISIIILIVFSKTTSPAISKSTIPMRAVLFLVGLWWACFTIPAAMWMRARPGPPLPSHVGSGSHRFRWLSYIHFAWASLWRTIKLAVQLRQVVVFLIAWFILSDTIATISGTAILFARTELHMGTAAVAGVSITSTVAGIAGAVAWPLIGKRFGLASNHIIIASIAFFEFIPVYGLLGFVPFIKKWGVGGLQQPWEIFPLACVHGFVLGGFSSHCRSFFGLLIPPGSEAAFYALYAVTDKGSSVIGPSIVGRIVDQTGTIRSAFWFLAVLNLLPGPLFWWVDAERGRADAVAMAKQIHVSETSARSDLDQSDGDEEREELLAQNSA